MTRRNRLLLLLLLPVISVPASTPAAAGSTWVGAGRPTWYPQDVVCTSQGGAVIRLFPDSSQPGSHVVIIGQNESFTLVLDAEAHLLAGDIHCE